MHSDSDAASPPADLTASSAPDAPRAVRLWVGGRLITGEVEVAAALESVRARAKRPLPEADEKPVKDGGERPQEAPEPPAANSEGADPEALARVAGQLFTQRRVQEAIQIYQSIVQVESTRAEANAGLGWCHLSLHDFDGSLRYFEAALEARPDFGRALYGAGVALIELGRLVDAASYAHRLAGLPGDEHRARGLYVLGLIDRARGAWSEAVAHLEESLKLHPHRRSGRPGWSEVRHRYELALCHRELNRPDRAEEHLRWAARHERKPGSITLDLANLYLEMERYDDARDRFQSVLKHDPQNRTAHIGLGRVRLGQRDHAAALQSFSAVLSKASNDLDALSGAAECCKALGKLDRAAGYLEQIRQLYKTPRVQLEQRLRSLEQERQMRDAELPRIRNVAAPGAMATGITHELRQPLATIRLAAQNARHALASGNTSGLEADLQEIDRGVADLDKIMAVFHGAATEEAATDEIELRRAKEADPG